MKHFSALSSIWLSLALALLFTPMTPALAGSPVAHAPSQAISQGLEEVAPQKPQRFRDRFRAKKNQVVMNGLSRLSRRGENNAGKTGLLLVLIGLGLIALAFVIPAATVWLLGLGLLSTLIGIFMGIGGAFSRPGTKDEGSTDNSGKVAGSVAAGLGITAVVLLVLLGIGLVVGVLLILGLVLGFIDGL